MLHDQAILRIWTLVCLTCRFLASLQATNADHVSIGSCRRQVRDEHRRLLLFWLQERFLAGATPDDLLAPLTA